MALGSRPETISWEFAYKGVVYCAGGGYPRLPANCASADTGAAAKSQAQEKAGDAAAHGFVALPTSECPADGDLSECSSSMLCGELCEADQVLPDGETLFDVNNCDGGYDVFRHSCGMHFEAVDASGCPSDPNLQECHDQMYCGELW